jgi:hypothetical protein
MGGIGSGRRYQGGKDTTSDYCSLDVRRLQRDGLLAPGRFFGWNWYRNDEKAASIQIHTQIDRVVLDYRHRKGEEEWKSQHYPVMLDWTACNLGGRRAWFLCPASGCRRRVALLYIGGSGIFACRHCYQLAYACQRETPDDRSARRADKIRDRLKWKRGILNGKGCKPKGMHWSTYQRLTAQHDAYVDVSLVGIARRLGILKNLLE